MLHGSPVLPLSALCRLQSLYIHPEIKQLLAGCSLQKVLEFIQALSNAMAIVTMATNIENIFLVSAPSLDLPLHLKRFCSFFHSSTPLVLLNFLLPPPHSFSVPVSYIQANFTFTGLNCADTICLFSWLAGTIMSVCLVLAIHHAQCIV